MLAMGVFILPCLLMAIACSKKPTDVVRLEFTGEAMPSGLEIRDLRFYIHDIFLTGDRGEKTVFTLENGAVALVNLNPDANKNTVTGRVNKQVFTGVEFKLGVPFQLNHADPLTANPPLNDGTLFWAWQQGYKFLRFDFMNGESGHSFHLGSTGCESASAIRPPEKPCAQPNIVKVALRGFDPTQRAIKVNLNWLTRLLAQGDIESCTGGYSADAVCSDIIERLGLDIATGQCIDGCSTQVLFE